MTQTSAWQIASNVGLLIWRALPGYINPYPAADKPLKTNAYKSTHPDHQQYLAWKLYESNQPLKRFSGKHVTQHGEVTRGFSAYLSNVIRNQFKKYFRDEDDNESLDALTAASGDQISDGHDLSLTEATNIIDFNNDFLDSASEVNALVDVPTNQHAPIGEQDARQRRINQLLYIVHGSQLFGTMPAERQARLDGWKFNPALTASLTVNRALGDYYRDLSSRLRSTIKTV